MNLGKTLIDSKKHIQEQVLISTLKFPEYTRCGLDLFLGFDTLRQFLEIILQKLNEIRRRLSSATKSNLLGMVNNAIVITHANIFSTNSNGIVTGSPNILIHSNNGIVTSLPNILDGIRIPEDMFLVYHKPIPNVVNLIPDSSIQPMDDTENEAISASQVIVSKEILDSMAAHAISCLEPAVKECYGTVYADKEGNIVKYHPFDSEEFTLRTEGSVNFTGEFYYHVKRLSKLYEHLGLRLAGDNHSHPNGNSQQSNNDIAFNESFWRNSRNTCFITAINGGSGSSDWIINKNGLEAKRKIGEHLIKTRAYAGTGKGKKKIIII